MTTFIKLNTKFYVINPLKESHHQLINAPAHYIYRIVAQRPRPDGNVSRNCVYRVIIVCHSSNDNMAKQAINDFWIQFSNEAPEYIIVRKRRIINRGSRIANSDVLSFDRSLFSSIDF